MVSIFLFCFLSVSNAEFRYSADFYLFAQKSEIAESAVNPQNSILRLDHEQVAGDFRAELKWRSESDLMVARPRFLIYEKRIEIVNNTETIQKSEMDLTDAFYEKTWSDEFSSTLGLQVFQWGPAEFLNPSNPFYHFNYGQRSVIYKEKGKVLLRLNYSADKNSSVVFAVEPVSNNELEWMDGAEFNAKFAVKFEMILNEMSDYAGVSTGLGERNVPFVGEYFSISPKEGLSIYGDARQSLREANFVPDFNGIGYEMVESDSQAWPFLGVFGLRWEGDYDTRIEYIHNSAGYSNSELRAAIGSAGNPTSPLYLRNAGRFFRSGLELPGLNYGYISHRIAEPFELRNLNFYARLIYSVQDASQLTQLEFDKVLWDEYLVFSNINVALGSDNSEFRLTNSWQVLAGIKWGL